MFSNIKKGKMIFSSALSEVKANLVAINLYPLGLFEVKQASRKHSVRSKNPRPILLVHGIFHNRSAFISLKRRMQKEGWDNIYTLNYSTSHGNILQMVENLSDRVDDIIKKTEAPQIDIIAHSLGGLVARTYMSLGEGRGKIKKLVTLGTAHQGTQMSILAKGMGRGALDGDLKPKSYLINLLSTTALPRGSELVSIFSNFDWTVIPATNAEAVGLPETSIKNIRLDYVGHTGLLYSAEAFENIIQTVTS